MAVRSGCGRAGARQSLPARIPLQTLEDDMINLTTVELLWLEKRIEN
jgi:hypothetical protein